MHHSDSAIVTTVDALAKLLDVCGELRASEQVDERAVTGCSFDSRAVSAGDVFFCKGAAFKPAFLRMALDAGAVAFVCEESLVESLEPLAQESGAAMLVVDSVRTAMALLPPEVYDRPDRDVKIVGITGRSGSGKSTFLRLLMRFWDVNTGTIRFGEEDIRRVNTAALRAQESLVTQETELFDDTIENNIRIAKRDATREEVEAACKKAALDGFIRSLPKGYDTPVGELGGALSGGERQRIGVARAFLHDAPFLLLDEPTSNLDSLNEGVILKAVRAECKDKTVLLVSHRKSTMAAADISFSVESGRLS